MARRFSESDLASARDRFYPYWWLHKVSEKRTVITDMPSYTLVCANEAERELALASKPRYLDAHVMLSSEAGLHRS
ncbi:MAG TPA: hypothetical protein VNL97_06935 [Solirubrobacterales bacterium]|nr:hypothetical protein [Solirubrobacterales bacterium]